MVLTPAALETFRQALRARPASVAELRDLVPLGDAEFAAALQELMGAGCLSIDSQQRLGVVSPSQAIGDVVGQRIAEHQEQVRSALEQARDDLRVLQSLARDWAIGGTPGEVLPATFVHGPMAGRDAAQLLFERRGPVPSLAVLPDVRSLEKPPPEVLEPFLAMLRQKPEPDRILLGPYDGTDTDLAETLELLSDAGTEFRTHPTLPGWFAVDADDTVLLPSDWGTSWPTNVLVVTDPGVAGLARSRFEARWSQAHPVFDRDPSWAPLLRLMAAGATTEGAARTLGISARTARRRINDAMRHHKAHTLYDLGVAVARSR